jgi:GTPase SAR1 family protein
MGADFMAKEVERGGKCLHIQLWDRPMACSTRLLCRGAVGLVYVYDVTRRETFDALAARHEEIVWHFPDGVPPIIIGALTPPTSWHVLIVDQCVH